MGLIYKESYFPTTEMIVSIIVAVAENNAIGKDNQLPWHLPDELKLFKKRTLGHPIIMGRKTFESIGRPLPGRTSIVVTRTPTWTPPEGVQVAISLEDALRQAAETATDEAFVIGGGQLYSQALPLTDKIYLTRVACRPEADTFFGPLPIEEWEEVEREHHPADTKHAFAYEVLTLLRRRSTRP